ncbi:gamma-glutamylcyclotransferase family protein [Photobacterium sanguinicancri]|uniref:Gamma-glutamylcyclotransferase family protein n=1 Tax=Photobacterium sanguinicancri TaxID=875932 RepID=A0AAW7YA88_9GAMM|nr:gamma-glutamylcyclotransferase [Photobacterium sanguinicancri]MDO6545244.1 gamma-glutamylcyclotransferase [Photobacterium sanguinicancri]
MMSLVFVYGTLRQGESNHHLLADAKFLGEAELTVGYALYDLGAYPGAVIDELSVKALYGEVYQVNATTFEVLDRLEQYPTGYTRELVVTPYGQAWVYLYLHSLEGMPLITSGNWCQH